MTPRMVNKKCIIGSSVLKRSFNAELIIPLLPKKNINASAIIIAGTHKGTLESASKNFLPLKFFFAQKYADNKPMPTASNAEKKACITVKKLMRKILITAVVLSCVTAPVIYVKSKREENNGTKLNTSGTKKERTVMIKKIPAADKIK